MKKVKMFLPEIKIQILKLFEETDSKSGRFILSPEYMFVAETAEINYDVKGILAQTDINRRHILINYHNSNETHTEQEFCQILKTKLETDGYNVRIDVVENGSEFTGETNELNPVLKKAVNDSFCVLACLSADFENSMVCKAVNQYATRIGRPIVPVIIGKSEASLNKIEDDSENSEDFSDQYESNQELTENNLSNYFNKNKKIFNKKILKIFSTEINFAENDFSISFDATSARIVNIVKNMAKNPVKCLFQSNPRSKLNSFFMLIFFSNDRVLFSILISFKSQK